jgi:hypothetical protein
MDMRNMEERKNRYVKNGYTDSASLVGTCEGNTKWKIKIKRRQ